MQTLQVIGNLGANAEIKHYNGSDFVSFRVADTQKFNDKEVTTWIDCTMNGNGGKLLPFLQQGAKVFVSGRPAYHVYDSAKYHCKMVGVQLFVNQCELCGGSTDLVPRELVNANGEVVKVYKFYVAENAQFYGQVLTDKNMKQYECNENGWIAPCADDTK